MQCLIELTWTQCTRLVPARGKKKGKHQLGNTISGVDPDQLTPFYGNQSNFPNDSKNQF